MIEKEDETASNHELIINLTVPSVSINMLYYFHVDFFEGKAGRPLNW